MINILKKISWTDGRTDRDKTVYPPPPPGSGGITNDKDGSKVMTKFHMALGQVS